jgi:chorismate--pyruvate lyase
VNIENDKNQWHPLSATNQHLITEAIRPWLIETGSLTTKLKELCVDAFSVQLIDQTVRVSTANEQKLLQLASGDEVIVRQVYLLCGETVVVYARSLIPILALQKRFASLDKLGEKPLGEKIFSDPQLERSQIEWMLINAASPLYPTIVQRLLEKHKPEHVFGRRSLFYGAVKPILISEYFLPAIAKLQ